MKSLLKTINKENPSLAFICEGGTGHVQISRFGFAIFFNHSCIMTAKTLQTIEKILISLGVTENNFKQ